ncbi:MAG: carbohydrate kinase family protein [Eubacteriales bacterium]|nr:carbohydrate kinase family protein [Eubacteriales bacterium]
MARIVCAGHLSLDIPYKAVDKSVFTRDTTFVDSAYVTTGGDALNCTANLTKLGLGKDLKYVSVIGDDAFGKMTLADLEASGINTSSVRCKKDVGSFATVVLISEDGERHFMCAGNANRNVTVDDVLSELSKDTELLHIGSFMSLDMLEGEYMARMFQTAQSMGIKTSFDVTYDSEGKWLKKIEPGLPYSDIMFASYDEAVSLSGYRTPEEIGAFFLSKGVKQFVLKNGEEGCYAASLCEKLFVPAYHCVPVVDTTGAGDAFVSGYLYGFLHGLSTEECCVLGCAQGAMCIRTMGAHIGTGTLLELKEFIRENGALTLDSEELLRKF